MLDQMPTQRSFASFFLHSEECASSKNLKDLTISFDPFSGTDWGNEAFKISTCRMSFFHFDVPLLERYRLSSPGDSSYVVDDAAKHIQDAMGMYFPPSLIDRGLLSVGIASLATAQDDAWSRAGY